MLHSGQDNQSKHNLIALDRATPFVKSQFQTQVHENC